MPYIEIIVAVAIYIWIRDEFKRLHKTITRLEKKLEKNEKDEPWWQIEQEHMEKKYKNNQTKN